MLNTLQRIARLIDALSERSGRLIAWLTLALMHTGAKIVSLTAGDRSAVKHLLQGAFGKSFQRKMALPDRDAETRTPARPHT